MKKLIAVCVFLLIVSCDPVEDQYINSVVDGNGHNLNISGNTEVNPSVLTINFKNEMNADTVNSDNITVLCGDDNPEIEIVEGKDANSFDVFITEAWRYALIECDLNITNQVQTKSGEGIPNRTYSFTNSCAVSDDFNADSISDDDNTTCWQIFTGSGVTKSNWASMSGFMGIDGSLSDLIFDFSSATGNTVVFYKEISLDEDFDISIYYPAVSGVNRQAGNNFSQVELMITNKEFPLSNATDQLSYTFGIQTYDSNQDCYVAARDVDLDTLSVYRADCSNEAVGYTINFSNVKGVFTREYTKVGGPTQNLSYDTDTDAWTDLGLKGNLYLYLIFKSPGGVAGFEAGTIGYIDASGITVTGQY